MESKLTGKIAIVTGASSGIGKVTALELAKASATVVMVCRPGKKAENAFTEINTAVGKNNLDLIFADFSSQESIRACVNHFKKKYQNLHILVNNAGIFLTSREMTVDGLELTFATNHLGYFLFTNLLLDILIASAPARIISVASYAERWGKIDFNDLQTEHGYTGMKAYSQSKLANILFTYELARRLSGTNVSANCLHPGVVNTGWARDAKGIMKLGMSLISPFLITPQQGAKTSIYLASSQKVEGVSGKYFKKCKPAQSQTISYDKELAAKLWDVSKTLTGL